MAILKINMTLFGQIFDHFYTLLRNVLKHLLKENLCMDRKEITLEILFSLCQMLNKLWNE